MHVHKAQDAQNTQMRHDMKPAEGEATDPVCGMRVARKPGALTAEHGGQTYYFCSPRCREKFTAHPDQYVGAPPAASEKPESGADVKWTCPMHPEIVRDAP